MCYLFSEWVFNKLQSKCELNRTLFACLFPFSFRFISESVPSELKSPTPAIDLISDLTIYIYIYIAVPFENFCVGLLYRMSDRRTNRKNKKTKTNKSKLTNKQPLCTIVYVTTGNIQCWWVIIGSLRIAQNLYIVLRTPRSAIKPITMVYGNDRRAISFAEDVKSLSPGFDASWTDGDVGVTRDRDRRVCGSICKRNIIIFIRFSGRIICSKIVFRGIKLSNYFFF